MTEADFLALLNAPAGDCPVQASELIEDAYEVAIGDTLMCLQWGETDSTIELTVPLPDLEPGEDAPGDLASLYRLVLQRQWQQGSADGVYFGVLPLTNELVGMVALAGDDIASADDLRESLKAALVAVETAWYETAAQWWIDNARPPQREETPPADGLGVLRA